MAPPPQPHAIPPPMSSAPTGPPGPMPVPIPAPMVRQPTAVPPPPGQMIRLAPQGVQAPPMMMAPRPPVVMMQPRPPQPMAMPQQMGQPMLGKSI